MKSEEATAGRWVESNSHRLHIVGRSATGGVVVEDDDSDFWTMKDFSCYELLPPECDSFNWKPGKRKIVLTEWIVVCQDGSIIKMWRQDKPLITSVEKIHAIGTREIEVPL